MMKKRFLSLLLSFTLLLAVTPAAMAKEDNIRKTHFFTEIDHADIDYDEIEYVHIERKAIMDRIKAVRALLPDKSNTQKAAEEVSAITDMIVEIETMNTLASIRHSQNVLDQDAADELAYTESICAEAIDAYNLLIRDALLSPCAGGLKSEMTEEDIALFSEYTAMTQDQLNMLQKERELETKYEQAAAGITVPYKGKEWTEDSAWLAYVSDTLDADGYQSISQSITEKKNKVLGAIYLELVDLRTKFAKSCGYENYADYAYAEIYGRDYSPADIKPFHQAVKDGGFYEISNELYQRAFAAPDLDVYYGDYANEETLDLVEGYMGKMSSELAEAYDYMHSHGFYDIAEGECKDGTGYTTVLSDYSAPFFFSTPSGFFGDFMRIVHEFGHYNEYYWCYDPYAGNGKSIDISEVHSQGLELLFTHWYDDIFEDSSQFAQDVLMMYLVEGICTGALYDELQQYVYTTDNVTLKQINQKYSQLCSEYGMTGEDSANKMLYDWVQVDHNFTSPCYYISYAVSAAGAFNFWLDAQKDDYFDAVDDYLRFAALPSDVSFQESFTTLGMTDPLSPNYLSELSSTLRSALDLELYELDEMPQDLTGSEWFADIVYELYISGVIEQDAAGCIHPYSKATWNDAASLAAQIRRDIPAAKDGKKEITRLEFIHLLSETFKLGTSKTTPFSDTKDGTAAFLAEKGVISGYADGTFRPNQTMSRAEMWVMFYRTLMYAAEQLLTDLAA